MRQSLRGLRSPSEQTKTSLTVSSILSNAIYAAARPERTFSGRGRFKDDPGPAPSRNLTEERPAESGRDREASGTRDLCPRGKATCPSARPTFFSFNFSLSSFLPEPRFPLVFLLSNLTACSGVQPRPLCLPRPAAHRAPPRLWPYPPPPRPASPLTSDLVSADPQLDINSRSPKSQPVHPSGPRAGALSPAAQVRGTTSSQSWGCSGRRGRAGGGGQSSCRRRRKKGEGCRQPPRRPPAPPEAEVGAAAAALCSG